MSRRHEELDGVTWMNADVRRMDAIASGTVDVAFDKGTLDAMIHGSPWDPPNEVRENTGSYIREVCHCIVLDSARLNRMEDNKS
jgi:EEF1A lysine methyltransferase 4